LGVWPIAVFTLISLGGTPGLPHWPALGYLMCIPLLGRWAAARDLTIWARASAAIRVAVVLMAVIQTITGILPLGPRADPTLDLVDWRDLQGVALPTDGFVAATSWLQAGKVAYALGPRVPVLCLSVAPHQYQYQRDPAAFVGHDALLVIRPPAHIDRYAPYFASIEPLGPLTIHRQGGRPALSVDLFLAHDFRAPFPTTQAR
jgi:hypothetical protein